MIHNSAATGYQLNSDLYAKARPNYHPELMHIFKQACPKGKLVELGAGTGIFTAQLLDIGYSPIAIEPVEEMRAKLTNKLPNIDVRNGTAEETGLESASMEAVVVAQAFHWFHYQKALAEIKRILRSNGLLICVWNVRDESIKWVGHYESIVNKYAGDTPRHRTMAWREAIDSDDSFELMQDWAIPNPQLTTPDGVVERALSTSFIAALNTDTQNSIAEKIQTLVSTMGDTFEFPYHSEIQVWRKANKTNL